MEVNPVKLNHHEHDDTKENVVEETTTQEEPEIKISNPKDKSDDENVEGEDEVGEQPNQPESPTNESEQPNSDDYEPEGPINNDQNEKEGESADEYNPEIEAAYDPNEHPSPPEIPNKPENPEPKKPSGLPARPQVPQKPSIDYSVDPSADPHQYQRIIRLACDEITQSESSNNPNFHNLSDYEKFKIISPQLEARGITLNTGTSFSQASDINFDQVYSYNKPYKNLKNPIPLVPINEFCRRPNVTLPMTPEEDALYDEFIKTEADYMRDQNCEDFPDKSRLFLGNLPANTISKQDLFRIFNKYGEVVQIAIKAGYGFAQFRTMESCLDCIKGETYVPLHNKIMRLDASKPQPSKKFNNNQRGRERYDDDNSHKKAKRNPPECQIYTTGKSSVFFVRRVKRAIQNAQVSSDIEDVTHREISEVISEAAYSGVLGTCVIKESKVDIQTFETSPDGGIKFDEYADIEPEDAADILQKAKLKKYGGTLPPFQGDNFDAQYGSNDNSTYGGHYNDRGRGRGRGRGNSGARGGRGRGGYNQFNQGYQGYDQGQFDQHYGQQYGQQGQYPGQYDQQAQYGQGQYGNQYNQPPQYGNQMGYNQQSPPQNYGQQQAQYGQPPAQYGQPQAQYGQPQAQYGQPQAQYGQPPIPAQYGQSNPPPQQNQTDLYQTLQNLDPAAKQSVLSILQQQQQPTPQPSQPQPQPHHHQSAQGYNQNYNQSQYEQRQPINYGDSSGYQSRSARYSSRDDRIDRNQGRRPQRNYAQNYGQSFGGQYGEGPQPPRNSNQNNDNSSTTSSSLMDTLAKLSKK
ncbi:hypothetical protein CLIB1444_01S09978 [[Candida] jaroonii]|uniref:Uncharacterized protein n=1 Tax=[Candida] jaroonii TaxID=467808 RepID=A0ACA9Y110_9ASCO|nr:hypothetical protein CLIB1444_01S09978 [[Candida] jaroonii]